VPARGETNPIATLVLLALVALATQPAASAGIPISDSDELLIKKYHLPLTKGALFSALHDADPGIRAQAAAKLAERGEKDALMPILNALASESYPGAKIHMALIVARLGDPAGINALKGLCGDAALSSVLRMSAAQALDDLGRENCLPDILGVLRSPDDLQATDMALNSLIYHHENASPAQLQEIRHLVPIFLNDGNVVVRMKASGVLGKFGDYSSVLDLRNALAREESDSGQTAMHNALQALEKRLGH
jgi:HEAT repeat protein